MNCNEFRKSPNRLRITFTPDSNITHEVIYPIIPITDEMATVPQQFDNIMETLEKFNVFVEHFTSLFEQKLKKYLERVTTSTKTKNFDVHDLASTMLMPIDVAQFLLNSYTNSNRPILAAVEIIDSDDKLIEHILDTDNGYRLSTLFFITWRKGDVEI